LDNLLFVHARRRLRRTWWRSWFIPALILIGGLYAFPAALQWELDNVDLIAEKILGCLMPFAVFFLLLIPAALLFGQKTTDITISTFGANWRFSAVIEGLWNRPVFETLLECFIGATLGVVFGIHRAEVIGSPSFAM
jgi:hypothetical protein